MEDILSDAHLLTTWTGTGTEPTPVPPGEAVPPLPPEVIEKRATLVAEAARLEAVAAGTDSRVTELATADAEARRTIERLDRQQRERVEDWGETKIKRAGNAQIAGGVFLAIGGAVLIGTVGAMQAGAEGAKRFLPIGLGISIPLAVTGVLFIVGGAVHKKRVREVLGSSR